MSHVAVLENRLTYKITGRAVAANQNIITACGGFGTTHLSRRAPNHLSIVSNITLISSFADIRENTLTKLLFLRSPRIYHVIDTEGSNSTHPEIFAFIIAIVMHQRATPHRCQAICPGLSITSQSIRPG